MSDLITLSSAAQKASMALKATEDGIAEVGAALAKSPVSVEIRVIVIDADGSATDVGMPIKVTANIGGTLVSALDGIKVANVQDLKDAAAALSAAMSSV